MIGPSSRQTSVTWMLETKCVGDGFDPFSHQYPLSFPSTEFSFGFQKFFLS